MPTAGEFHQLLASLPVEPVDFRLTRIVPYLSYNESENPSFLYTSGRPNRCNPRNVQCLYLSAERQTAQAEYDANDIDPTQPTLTYHARLQARCIVDLTSSSQRDWFKIPDSDLTANFRLDELDLQRLGEAISKQNRVVAIRYPSRAMLAKDKTGFNLAIFPSAMAPPDSLVIYGQRGRILERWPKS